MEGHGHSAHATGRAEDRRALRLVLTVTLLVVVVELVGAWLSGSLALLADAGHMVTDAAAVLIALSASYVATLPATSRRTFGYHRAEILAALVNALVLLGVCGFLVVVGVQRLVDPPEVHAGQMVGFALVGLAANVVAVGILAGRRDTSLNMRAVWLEVLGDTLGSVAAVVAGVVIMTTGFLRSDAIASLLIALLILPRSWSLLRDSVAVLLETTPRHLDLDEVREHLLAMPGVMDVHHLHAWSITSGMPMLSAHVSVTQEALAARGVGALLDECGRCVAVDFGIEHATFQVEPEGHRSHENLGACN